jgi:hypothetical protein
VDYVYVIDCIQSTHELSELRASHDSVVVVAFLDPGRFEDTCFLGNGNCSLGVVTSYHAYSNTCLIAKLNCVGHGLSDGVLDAYHTNYDQFVLDVLLGGGVGDGGILLVGEEEGSKGSISKLFELVVEGVLECFSYFGRLTGGVEVTITVFDEVIRCSLSVNCNFSVLIYDCAHGLGFR